MDIALEGNIQVVAMDLRYTNFDLEKFEEIVRPFIHHRESMHISSTIKGL